MNKILEFKDNNINYILFKENGKLKYGKIINDVLRFDLSIKEKENILSIVKEIIPKKNIIRLHDLKTAKKTFAHLMDKTTGLHLFFEKCPDGLKIPDKNMRIELNSLFNNQELFVAFKFAEKNKNNDFYKRLIKKGTKLIVVLISTTLAVSLSGDLKEEFEISDDINDETLSYEDVITSEIELNQELAKEETIVLPQEDTSTSTVDFVIERLEPKTFDEQYDIDFPSIEENIEPSDFKEIEIIGNIDLSNEEKETRLIETIANNSNLTDSEKAFFLNDNYIKDAINYIEYEVVLDNLANLRILYNPYPSEHGIDGEWHYEGENKYTIEIFNCSCFEDCDKSVLSHEFSHVFTDYMGTKYLQGTFGVGFLECINFQLNNEYFGFNDEWGNYDKSYVWMHNYAYIIDEILGTEVLRKFHASGSPQVIIDALMEIIPDETKAMNVAIGMDFFAMSGPDDPNRPSIIYAGIKTDFEKDLRDFYEKKFNLDINDNEYTACLFQTPEFCKSIMDTYGISDDKLDFFKNSIKFERNQPYFNEQITEDSMAIISFATSFQTVSNFYSYDELIKKYPDYAFSDCLPLTTEDGLYIVDSVEELDKTTYTIESYTNKR